MADLAWILSTLETDCSRKQIFKNILGKFSHFIIKRYMILGVYSTYTYLIEEGKDYPNLPLIQEGQLSVSSERMCTILVNR